MLRAVNIAEELAKVRTGYEAAMTSQGFNSLIYGGMGTGKTFSLRTARKPVLVHSFDQGGSNGLREYVERGEIFVDRRWETEDSKKPVAFTAWAAEFDRLRQSDFFSQIGTFALDSVTLFSDAVMNRVLQIGGRAGQNPQLQDYMTQMRIIRDYIKLMSGLPCDFVALAHIIYDKDELSGEIMAGPYVTGKLSLQLPSLFDEVYVATTKQKANGVEYQWLTQSNGRLQARSRLSAGGKLDMYETPDFKAVLKKAGLATHDIVAPTNAEITAAMTTKV